MELADILPQLTDWFPVEDHKKRQLKGGGSWYFIPHQAIRDRLNQVCPGEWSTEYDGPHLTETGDPIYHCRLTICGITRTGIGDKSNEPSLYGTAAQRAFRKAFVDSAEMFGIGEYLDEQKDDRTKRKFIQYMQKNGNGEAAVLLKDQMSEGDTTGKGRSPGPPPKQSRPFGQKTTAAVVRVITEAQRKRLFAIATQEGKYSDQGFRSLVEAAGYASSKDILVKDYDRLCDEAKDVQKAIDHNRKAQGVTP
jgi:hypothetical protein